MAEVHQNNDFIDSPDPFWDGSPYIAEPTDDPCFVEYANQLKTTEGFHVDFVPESIFWTPIVPENVDSKYTIEAANEAVTEFNKLKGADLKLSKILNANCLMISSALHFLTLQCSDGSFYEAKIDMIIGEGCKLVMFRPAKYWPREDKNTNEEGGAEPEGSQIIEKKTMSEPKFTVSKILSNSDINSRLALPTTILKHIVIPKRRHFVDLQVMDSGNPWIFRLYTQPIGIPKPAFTAGWIRFVKTKHLQVGDRLTIYGRQDGELHIQVTKTSNVTNEVGGAEPEGSQIIEKKTMSEPTFTVSKILTNSDITARLALPATILQHIVIPQGRHFVDLQVTDSGELWKFRLYTLPNGMRANPVFTMGWIDFVRAKCLQVGDKLTIYGFQDGELHIQVTKTSNVTYPGEPV